MHSAKTDAPGERKAVLRQIARADALHGDDGAVIQRLDARQNFQQRGFAGAVAADNAGAFLGIDQPVEIFEKEFGAEAFPGSGKLNHASVARCPTSSSTLCGRIVDQNPSTAFAKHHLVAPAEFLHELRPHADMAGRTTSLIDFGDRDPAAGFAQPFIFLQNDGRDFSSDFGSGVPAVPRELSRRLRFCRAPALFPHPPAVSLQRETSPPL